MNFDCGIYSIESPSGKVYIGQAQSFTQRWAEHRSHLRAGKHKNRHLQNAWNKYGERRMLFTKIAIVSVCDLDWREQEQIDARHPDDLYNIALEVGFSRRGVKSSIETRAKISAAKKGQLAGEKHPFFGRKRSIETISKIAAAKTGRTASAAHRAKISAANAKRRHSDETKAKMSASGIGKRSGADSAVAKSVVCIETGQLFGAMTLAVEWLRANGRPKAGRSSIAKVCKSDGRQNSAYGYTWRYADVSSDACGEFNPKLDS